jgi:hypothetical protein
LPAENSLFASVDRNIRRSSLGTDGMVELKGFRPAENAALRQRVAMRESQRALKLSCKSD